MESIEKHIQRDKEILDDSTISPQMRRHTQDELMHLERYAKEHAKEIEAGDHHDPTAFEMYCDENPDADECRIYEDWCLQNNPLSIQTLLVEIPLDGLLE